MANRTERAAGGRPPGRTRPRGGGARPGAPRRGSVPPAPASDRIGALSQRLLHEANGGLPRVDYLARLLELLLSFSGAETAALWLREGAGVVRCDAKAGRPRSFRFAALRTGARGAPARTRPSPAAALDALGLAALAGEGVPAGLAPRTGGTLVTEDVPRRPAAARGRAGAGAGARAGSVLLVPIRVGDERIGVLGLVNRRRGFFPPEMAAAYERLAPILGCALVSQRAQAAVHERVKELTCLYGITQLAERPELGLEQVVDGVVRLLPPAWQYPDITAARIVLDGRAHATPGYRAGAHAQSAEVVVNRVSRGAVTVSYLRRMPEIDEGPFLREERSLIDAVARQVALIVERREAAAARAELEEQLRHADRLATIGQLAAGVAHELNEPLGNVLGFAQLARKAPGAGAEVAGDLDKIAAAALHAREIVKKLVVFARQAPPTKTEVNLNAVVNDGLYFVEARCAKQGIELVRRLSPTLPRIVADPSQLQQVLVNLVVNAVQAMPHGGRLTIRTDRADGHVRLTVADTGTGMTEEVRRRIFVPFFTTKDVDEGTGLGLSVVHGIVSAHGGSISVESAPGRGSTFEVLLPIAGAAAYKETDPNAVFW